MTGPLLPPPLLRNSTGNGTGQNTTNGSSDHPVWTVGTALNGCLSLILLVSLAYHVYKSRTFAIRVRILLPLLLFSIFDLVYYAMNVSKSVSQHRQKVSEVLAPRVGIAGGMFVAAIDAAVLVSEGSAWLVAHA